MDFFYSKCSSYLTIKGYSRSIFSNFIEKSIAIPNELSDYIYNKIIKKNVIFDKIIDDNNLYSLNPSNVFYDNWDSYSAITNITTKKILKEKYFNRLANEFLIQSALIIINFKEIKNLDFILKYSGTALTSIDCIIINDDESFKQFKVLSNSLIRLFSSPLLKSIILIGFPNKIHCKCIENKNVVQYYEDTLSYPRLELFTTKELIHESQKHHTYFNRKLYIGSNGEIKNAPECKEIHGNINDVNTSEELKKIISSKEFQKYWFVHKEICDVCKDCEFRYICTDCRAFLNSDYEKPKKCSYDPYKMEWM